MADSNCNWDYGLEHGPQHWGSNCNELCDNGLFQSPINIETSLKCDNVSTESLDIQFANLAMSMTQEKSKDGTEILTYKLAVNEGQSAKQTLKLKGNTYKLAQFHLHLPAEHTINGKQYPGCIHFVHVNEDSQGTPPYAVIEMGLQNGSSTSSQSLKTILDNIDANGAITTASQSINTQDMISSALNAYSYLGSFTTPPCTEGVQFVISEKALDVNANDFTKLDKIKSTVRATQNINGRDISCASSDSWSYLLSASLSAITFLSAI